MYELRVKVIATNWLIIGGNPQWQLAGLYYAAIICQSRLLLPVDQGVLLSPKRRQPQNIWVTCCDTVQ